MARSPCGTVVARAAFVGIVAATATRAGVARADAPPPPAVQRQIAAIAATAERPSVDAATEVIRAGLRPSRADARVRDAAVTGLRAMGGDPEVAGFLRRSFDQEWSRGNADVVVGLALVLLPRAGADGSDQVLGTLDRGQAVAAGGVSVVEAIADAAARRGDADAVATIVRLAELGRFKTDFAFRRGLVGCLTSIRRPEAVEAAIPLLAGVQGEVRMDLVRYLAAVSGRQHGVDATAWQGWWRESRETFRFPERLVLPAHDALDTAASGDYYGIPLYARSIVFVIDTSGSMDGMRLAAAQRELVEAIGGLDPEVWFTIVVFNARADAWQARLVAADRAAKEAAVRFVASLEAGGSTATYDALEAAFRFDAEAIFLLSDGQPTSGRIVHPNEIFGFVARANEARRISLYTIGVMPDAPLAAFLRALAEQNRGCYRQVDR